MSVVKTNNVSHNLAAFSCGILEEKGVWRGLGHALLSVAEQFDIEDSKQQNNLSLIFILFGKNR